MHCPHREFHRLKAFLGKVFETLLMPSFAIRVNDEPDRYKKTQEQGLMPLDQIKGDCGGGLRNFITASFAHT